MKLFALGIRLNNVNNNALEMLKSCNGDANKISVLGDIRFCQ